MEQDYQTRSSQLSQSIEADLAAVRSEGPNDPVAPTQSIIRELQVLNKLYQRKTAELHHKTTTANAFYGGDPFNWNIHDYMLKATKMEQWPGPNGIAMQALNQSLSAANDARLLSLTIHSLGQRNLQLTQTLNALQAAETARLAAEQEAQRVAAEQARLRAQANALAHAQEQARLAAMAEAERLAFEKARIAAEVTAQYFAAEQARLEAEAEAQRQADQLFLENQRQAEEKALRDAVEAAKAAQGDRPFPVSGAAAASGPVLTVTAGAVATSTATSLAIQTSLRAAVSAVLAAAAASAGAVVGGFAALLVPSPLGNSDLYALSVPLTDLTSHDPHDLHAIAEANGEIALPVAIGSRTVGNTTEFFVAATNGTTVPAKVPVRLATFDPGLNAYQAYNPDVPSIGMTWTPIVKPNDASTTLPAGEQKIAVYDGASATALEGRLDEFPELDLYSFGGFINVFPVDSGIPPQYVVFNSPYEGAIVEGEHSGRDFNPEEAGGPILKLEWKIATAAREGTDVVILHTSKFPSSNANKVMIDRLERILSGELEMTDTDKRFYTHEIREFERFRALGYSDTETPDISSPAWNNVHTATLEDYKLKDDPTLLYTSEALAAAKEQEEREFQTFLKEMWQ
ncbi:S-type pyocin domain-containing protein [Pseudomonas fluorescens]|nr:S-type pyocin domain-containing protein [Pseudomonas fluorescens]